MRRKNVEVSFDLRYINLSNPNTFWPQYRERKKFSRPQKLDGSRPYFSTIFLEDPFLCFLIDRSTFQTIVVWKLQDQSIEITEVHVDLILQIKI